MNNLTMENNMKTNIYDINFKNEIKGYTISALEDQIAECVEFKSIAKEHNCSYKDYELEIKLLKSELKNR